MCFTRTWCNRQEDAHEYISWLLAAADDEMRAVMNLTLDDETRASASAQDSSAADAAAAAAGCSEADGEWETVGKRSGGGGLVTQVINRSRCDAAAKRNPHCVFPLTACDSTPLALIFSGSLATSVHRQVWTCLPLSVPSISP
jgi:hypothetical protein